MKKLSITIILLALLASPCHAFGPAILGAMSAGGAAATTQYFGWTTSNPTSWASGDSSATFVNDNAVVNYTCPGTGTQAVNSIEAFVKSASGQHFRLAIYDTSLGFVMQASAKNNVVSTTGAWEGKTTFTDQAGNAIASPTLTGGTSYRLAISLEDNEVNYGISTTSNAVKYCTSCSYSDAGFPSTLTAGSTYSYVLAIRVSVTGAP